MTVGVLYTIGAFLDTPFVRNTPALTFYGTVAPSFHVEHFAVLTWPYVLPSFSRHYRVRKETNMRIRRTLFLLPLLIVLTLGLTGCPSQTNIGKIKSDPDRYMDKDVGIAGRVTDSYGIPFVGGAYELDDGTGTIWVITEHGTPSRGSRVGVKGRVYSGATFHGRSFGTALKEEDRRVKSN
jgi:hypothetical protein